MDRIYLAEIIDSCNYRCTFCDRRKDSGRPRPTGQVLRELRFARSKGATTVRWSGGEPTLDQRLPRLMEQAQHLGFEQQELETNGARWITPDELPLLRAFGLTRVWLYSLPDAAALSITLDPSAPSRQAQAVEALAAIQIDTGLNIPLVPVTAHLAADLVERLHRSLGAALSAVRVHLIMSEWPLWPNPEVEAALSELRRRCRRLRVYVLLDVERPPPACAFSPTFLRHHAQLFGGHFAPRDSRGPDTPNRAQPACEKCALNHACRGPMNKRRVVSGAEVRRSMAFEATPVEADVAQTLLRVLGGEDRHRRAQVSELNLAERPAADVLSQKANLRVVWACNERCHFCWVDFDWTPPTKEDVLAEVARLRDRGHERISITGGEPTLVPWLHEVVAQCRVVGFSQIELQTNATLLGQGSRADELAQAGLTDALVSLHADRALEADRITARPGGFDASVAGADALLEAGVRVHFSFVLSGHNAHRTAAFVDFVAERWGDAVGIVWALAHPITEASTRDSSAVLPLDRSGPRLREALSRCLELGVRFSNVNEACGAPPCALGFDPQLCTWRDHTSDCDPAFTHTTVCSNCAVRPGCRGVRKAYLALHGERGLRAATEQEAAGLRNAAVGRRQGAQERPSGPNSLS